MKNNILKTTPGAAALACSGLAMADVTFYEYDNYGGRAYTAHDQVADFQHSGFNDRASSVVVTGRPWEVCDDSGYRGHCYILRPGNYPSLSSMGLNDSISSAREADRNGNIPDDRYGPAPLPGQVTFYEREGFRGRSFSTTAEVGDFRRSGFNDRASSATVVGESWQACDDAGFNGHCVFLRPGNYPSLAAMGMNDSISSVRMVPPGMPVASGGWAPNPPPAYDARPRPQEQLFQAQVLASHAVYGTPTQKCWVEQTEVKDERNKVGGAVLGGILGGILGHQVANGHGASPRVPSAARWWAARSATPTRHAHRGRATLPRRAGLGPAAVLGHGLHVPGRRAPCADDGPGGRDDHGEPLRRTAHVI